MAIRSRVAVANAVRDWETVLGGCFGKTRILPSDGDGIVERKGHFLILESKYDPSRLSRGHRLMLERLARKDGFTVLYIYGPYDHPHRLIWENRAGYVDAPGGVELLREWVSHWYRGANWTRYPKPIA